MAAVLERLRRHFVGGSAPSEDGERRVHFLRPGKTGGTALTAALLEYRDIAGYEIVFHGHETTLADVPVGERVLFLLRDPVSRFVSAFNGRLREDRPRYHYPWTEGERRAFARFKQPEELASALSSADQIERARAEDAMHSIGHISTPYSYWFNGMRKFRRRRRDLFFIAFQESLDDDFELLKQRLGLPAEARLPSDETAAHRMPASFPRELSDQARANLERWYANDIEFVKLCRQLAPTVNALPHLTTPTSHRRQRDLRP
jgi:Sulfotransferase family